MLRILTRSWWMVALRGALLVLFSILLFVNPGLTALSLAVWFAAFLMVDGFFTLIGAFSNWKESEDRWFILADGILGLLLGILLIRAPQVTLLFVTLTFAFWFIFSGVSRIAMGVQLRKEIKGEGWMILGGALSIIFGLIIFAQPGLGLSTVIMLLGIFAMIAGVTLLIVGFKLRKGDKWLKDKSPDAQGA